MDDPAEFSAAGANDQLLHIHGSLEPVCVPIAFLEAGAETWCAAVATRLALDSHLSRVLTTTAGVFTHPPRN